MLYVAVLYLIIDTLCTRTCTYYNYMYTHIYNVPIRIIWLQCSTSEHTCDGCTCNELRARANGLESLKFPHPLHPYPLVLCVNLIEHVCSLSMVVHVYTHINHGSTCTHTNIHKSIHMHAYIPLPATMSFAECGELQISLAESDAWSSEFSYKEISNVCTYTPQVDSGM